QMARGPGGGGPAGEGAPGGGRGGQGGRGGDRGNFGGMGIGNNVAPQIFAQADKNKDGKITKDEFASVADLWFSKLDPDKSGKLTEEKLQEGLNTALPRPNFAGAGGPGNDRQGGGRGGFGGGAGGGGPGGSWSTPVIIKTAARDELIVNFPNRLAAFDPTTGKQLWISKGIGGTIYTTPIWGEEILVASSSGMSGGNAIALKGGGTGEVSDSERLWRIERAKSGMGS